MIDKKSKAYLNNLKKNLLKTTKLNIEINKAWNLNFPDAPGVYVFFEKNKIVYVGETKSIKKRMKDVLRTFNHTLRRKVGESHFNSNKKYTKATSRLKYHPDIEVMVNDWFVNKMKMCFLPVSLGRKELEEMMNHEDNPKYNSNTRRGNQVWKD